MFVVAASLHAQFAALLDELMMIAGSNAAIAPGSAGARSVT